MIISPYYRFVFIAVPKTGTTSIEQALNKVLIEENPKRFFSKLTLSRSYQFCYRSLSRIHVSLPPPFYLPVPYKHEAVSSLKTILPFDIKKYQRFAFVRNPWARLVSQYKQFKRPHFLHNENRLKLHEASLVSFEAFVHRYTEDPRPMWKFLSDENGNLAIDHIGRFEHLESDFNKICRDLALPKIQIAHLNPAQGSTKKYQDYYSPQLLDKINPILKKDAQLFGYTFD